MEIFIAKAGQQTGPFTEEQLQPMLSSGMVAPTDLAWYEGLEQWTPLQQIFALSPPAPEPAPEPPVPAPVRVAPVARPAAGPQQPRAPAAAAPAARTQQPRAAVPVRAAVPMAAGRQPRAAAPGAAVPVRVAPQQGYRAGMKPVLVGAARPAHGGLRLAAAVIDSMVLMVLVNLIAWLGSFVIDGLSVSALKINPETLRDEEAVRQAMAGMLRTTVRLSLLAVGVNWLYFALMESSAKQGTLGKLICGLAVTGMEGQRVSFAQATGRWLSKFISALILYIGFLMCLWTEKRQCLHDILAGCLVVKK